MASGGLRGLWVGTVTFCAIGLGLTLLSYLFTASGRGFSKYDNSLFVFLVWLAVVQMWLAWICVFLSQLNPIISPYLNEGAH